MQVYGGVIGEKEKPNWRLEGWEPDVSSLSPVAEGVCVNVHVFTKGHADVPCMGCCLGPKGCAELTLSLSGCGTLDGLAGAEQESLSLWCGFRLVGGLTNSASTRAQIQVLELIPEHLPHV